NRWRIHHLGILNVHEPLRQLRKRQIPMADQLMRKRTGHSGYVDGRGPMLGNTPMTLLNQRPLDVIPVIERLWIRAAERLVTRRPSVSTQVRRVGAGLRTFHLRERVGDNLRVCNQLSPHFSCYWCLSAATPAPTASQKKTASGRNTTKLHQ